MFNEFTGIGNLGGDPESRFTQSGKQVVNFTVACEYGYGDNKKTEWVRCYAWAKLAEIIEQYCHKGSKVFFKGEMITRSWEKDGVKRYSTEINVQTLKMLSPKKGPNEPQQQGQQGMYPDATAEFQGEENVPF